MDLTGLTLRQIWENELIHELEEIADSTLAGYRDAISLWERHTENKPICTINRQSVKAFRDELLAKPYLRGKKWKQRRPATVNRIMRCLHAIVSPLWPADRKNTGALGLIPFFKWPRQLDADKQLPFVFSMNQLDALYRSCDFVIPDPSVPRRPSPLNDPRPWRVALVLALNCGARTWDLFQLTWGHVCLKRRENFKFGYVQFKAKKTGKLHKVPLNRAAAMHLADWKRIATTARVFPGFAKGKPFYDRWKRICTAAGVTAPFESMRKTCVTYHNAIVTDCGFWISGHVRSGVTGNYDNPSLRICRAIRRLKNPPSFCRAADLICERLKAIRAMKRPKAMSS